MLGRPSGDSLAQRLRDRFSTGLTIAVGTEPSLAAAITEATFRTGNFVRAQLAYELGRAYGSSEEAAMRLALALEYFHTASLLFDDLPSMDDATFRRGAPCLHHLYGEGTAILTALALINRAYALLWSCFALAGTSHAAEAAHYAERFLGLEGLLNGQSWDIHYAEQDSDDRQPQRVARGKTVGLIRLALVLPALLNGADPQSVRLLNHLAVFWGLAYQAIDDFKDVMHAPEQTGKTTARDHALDRPNLVLARGCSNAMHVLRRLMNCANTALVRLTDLDPRLACLEPAQLLLQSEVDKLVHVACEVTA